MKSQAHCKGKKSLRKEHFAYSVGFAKCHRRKTFVLLESVKVYFREDQYIKVFYAKFNKYFNPWKLTTNGFFLLKKSIFHVKIQSEINEYSMCLPNVLSN